MTRTCWIATLAIVLLLVTPSPAAAHVGQGAGIVFLSSFLVMLTTGVLEAQWEAHRALAQRFTRSGEVALTPEQIRTLRALGYIQ